MGVLNQQVTQPGSSLQSLPPRPLSMERLTRLIGSRIREERRSQPGLRLDDLATHAGISVSFLSMIERGLRLPHLETLAGIAAGLSVSMADLVTSTPPASRIEPLYRPLIAACRKYRLGQSDVARLTAMVAEMAL